MWEIDLIAAMRAVEKSMGYAVYRFGLCMGVAMGYLLATLSGAGTLVGFGSLAKNALALGPFGALLGFSLFGYLMFRIRSTWLNHVTVPQLGVLADQIMQRQMPTGKALIEYAKKRQHERYPSTTAMFEVDLSIKKVLFDISTRHPCPKLNGGEGIPADSIRWVTGFFSKLNHEMVLAWHFFETHENSWQSATRALGGFDKSFGKLLKNRVIAFSFAWIGFAASFPVILGGIQMLVEDIPVNMSIWPIVFAGVFSWAIKAAFLDAIAEAAMLELFSKEMTAFQGPISSTLGDQSPTYRDMEIKSGQFIPTETRFLPEQGA